MDLIEKLVGIAPDGGNGSLEVLIVSVVSALCLLSRARHRAAVRRDGRD